MFKTLKLLANPKNKDIRGRIWFTLFGLLIFAVGITIPVPGTQNAVSDLGLWDLYNTIAGGALKRFSIFALGVMPYISASIVTSLLQMDIVPYFTELKEQGAAGRQKINQMRMQMAGTGTGTRGYSSSGIKARVGGTDSNTLG